MLDHLLLLLLQYLFLSALPRTARAWSLVEAPQSRSPYSSRCNQAQRLVLVREDQVQVKTGQELLRQVQSQELRREQRALRKGEEARPQEPAKEAEGEVVAGPPLRVLLLYPRPTPLGPLVL